MIRPKFPEPFDVNGKKRFERGDVERYKYELMGREPPLRDPTAPIELITPGTVMAELDISNRTLLRRIAESRTAA